MTSLTSRNHTMFFVMTGCTGYIPVFRLVFCQNVIYFSMAGATVFRYNILTIPNNQWLMGHMTLLAAIQTHGIGMGQMTILTRLDLAVICMASCTGQFCMNAQIILKLRELLSMAGQAGCCYVTSELYFKGSMGVGMALHAIIKSKMFLGSCIMASMTVRNNLHVSRWMTSVAIQTNIFMCHSFTVQSKNNTLMTLPAIRGCNRGINGAKILLWHSICL